MVVHITTVFPWPDGQYEKKNFWKLVGQLVRLTDVKDQKESSVSKKIENRQD